MTEAEAVQKIIALAKRLVIEVRRGRDPTCHSSFIPQDVDVQQYLIGAILGLKNPDPIVAGAATVVRAFDRFELYPSRVDLIGEVQDGCGCLANLLEQRCEEAEAAHDSAIAHKAA
ncbi:MAG: hypothetical protein AAF416_15515 [Pseudomonadota bacterium]